MSPTRRASSSARALLAHLGREIDLLGATRALVLSTPGQAGNAQRIADALGSRAAGVFAEAVMHVPIETARAAREVARRLGADCAVAIGGGSTTGLGKGHRAGFRPADPGGSHHLRRQRDELDLGTDRRGVKKTGRDARVLPRTVIYDPELTLELPYPVTVTSAMNAIAHAAEGLYAPDGNPITALMAEEGIRASAAALPRLAANPMDLDARGDALYGAWLCGTVLGAVTMGLHLALCHTLGGSFGLPHAEVHAVILPHAVAYNASRARGDDAYREGAPGRWWWGRGASAVRSGDAPRCAHVLARHRHARRRAGPRGRAGHRRLPTRTRGLSNAPRCEPCCSVRSTASRPVASDTIFAAAPRQRSDQMKKILSVVCASALAQVAFAHHSAAMFDHSRTVTYTGTVKQFQYTNPHSWLQVMVVGSDGASVEWGFEAEGPSTLKQAGIDAKTFQPGEKLTIVANPMRTAARQAP